MPVLDPADISQVLAAGDVEKDGYPDLFVRTNGAIWALCGYTGASFDYAYQLNVGTAWNDGSRQLVNVGDYDADGTVDFLHQILTGTGRLLLRHGSGSTTATLMTSRSTAGTSRDGADAECGTGWLPTDYSFVVGTPNLNGDKIPDIWARRASDGRLLLFKGTATAADSGTTVVTSDWSSVAYFG